MAGRLRRRPDGPARGLARTAPGAARLSALFVIVAAWAACLALNWPGHFTWDSVAQLAEGRRGLYSGQHPPMMSWLLGGAAGGEPAGGTTRGPGGRSSPGAGAVSTAASPRR